MLNGNTCRKPSCCRRHRGRGAIAAVSWLVANLLRFAWRFRADIWQPDWVHQTTGDRNGHAFLSNPEGYSVWLGPRRAAISFPMPNSLSFAKNASTGIALWSKDSISLKTRDIARLVSKAPRRRYEVISL